MNNNDKCDDENKEKTNSNPLQITPEIQSIIDRVANYLAPRMSFSFHEVEDIKQEIAILSLEALKKYQENRGASLHTFVHMYVRRRLLNFKRDNYQRPIPVSADETKRLSMTKLNESKKNLLRAAPGGDTQIQTVEPMIEEEYSDGFPLLLYFEQRLPIEMLADYKALCDGAKIPKHRRKLLVDKLKELYGEKGDE